MEPFKRLTSKVSPLDRVNVDTDAIIPKQFLKRIERSGFGEFLFYDWRYNGNGQLNADFALNNPQYANSNILVTRSNFGCGSSREHAPWALLDYGFKVIIAPSFADIFYNNCFKNGILPVILSEEYVEKLFQSTYTDADYQIAVDLVSQTVTDNLGLNVSFEANSYRKECLLEGLDDISISLEHLLKIDDYENNIPDYYRVKV
ncbi:MAG: 3-isopropylmalate dehydratase small subunit [Paenibacillaceae bacterium]